MTIEFLLTPERSLAALVDDNPFPAHVQARVVYHDQVVYDGRIAYMVEIWQPTGFNFYLIVHGQSLDNMQIGLQLCPGRYTLDSAANRMYEILSPYAQAAIDFDSTQVDTAQIWITKQ